MTEERNTTYIESFKIQLAIYRKRWPYALVFFFLCLGGVFLYARYRTPNYQSTGQIMVSDDKRGSISQELTLLEDIGVLKGESNVANELELLRSRTLIDKVVTELNLNVETYALSKTTGLLKRELYQLSPFQIAFQNTDSIFDEIEFNLTILSESNYNLENKEHNQNYTANFGDTLAIDNMSICVRKSHLFSQASFERNYLLKLHSKATLVTSILSKLELKPLSKESTIISVKYTGSNVPKNNDIINSIFKQREIETIQDNNRISIKTSDFITARMNEISAQLSSVESNQTSFRIDKDLTDAPINASQYLTQQTSSESKILETSIQKKLNQFLLDYLNKHSSLNELLPNNIGINDPNINVNLTEYNKYIIEKKQLESAAGEKNNYVLVLKSKLESLRLNLVESIKNNISILELTLSQLQNQKNSLDVKLDKLAESERDYRTIEREQKILENLFLFLLQKKEENEISVAATVSNNKIIDYAYSDLKPIGLSKTSLMLLAILLGLFIPFGISVLLNILDNKINSIQELQAYGLNIVGKIPFVKSATLNHVFDDPRGELPETFRTLRTNTAFILGKSENNIGKIIVISSSMSNEGKSFTAFNLAQSYCLAGKRVALLELDLRRPSLNQYFTKTTSHGLSSYLAGVDTNIPEPIKSDAGSSNCFDFFACGIIPPNPAELLSSQRIVQLLEELKNRYDLVIIDTAPLSLVSDTSNIAHCADLCLFLIRLNFTKFDYLDSLLNTSKSLQLNKVHFILNGANVSRNSYNYYYSIPSEKPSTKKNTSL
jgi:tyrosine-protein kinase Etk/Wzc